MTPPPSRNKKPESFQSHVLPHGTLEQVIPGRLWRVSGSMPIPLPREMDIYRLPDGESLLLYSVMALDEDGMNAIEALGKPVILYVPNTNHHLDIGVYADRYPEAKVICPQICREVVEKYVKVDLTIEEELKKHEGVFEAVAVKGVSGLNETAGGFVVLVADVGDTGKVLFLGDLLHNIHKVPEKQGIFWKFFWGWVLGAFGSLHMTRFAKWFILKNKAVFVQWLKDLALEYQIAALMMCHGDPITEVCNDRLMNVAETL